MRAILLAAGEGTRLRPITYTTPKCLVNFSGFLLLEIWLHRLIASNIKPILINTHYLSEQVEKFVNSSKYKEYVVLVNEVTLLGTAGTLVSNLKFFDSGPIMLIHADNLSIFDINEFILAHKNKPKHCQMTMMLFETDSPENCGIVEVDEDGVLIEFIEKPKNSRSKLANAAIYIIDYELANKISKYDGNIYDFSNDVIPKLVGSIYTYTNNNYHRDIGSPNSYEIGRNDFEKNKFKWGF
jgi:mannose-1-phosphate guanylyltransferase